MGDPFGDASWASRLLSEALDALRADRCWLGSARTPEPEPDDPALICNPSPRLTVVLAGRCRHALSRQGRRELFPGEPGQAVFHAGDAWSLRLAQEPTRFVGLVFARAYLRVLEGAHLGGRTPMPARMSYHARALGGSGLRIVQALSQRAESAPADAEIEGHLVRALLLSAREQLKAPPASGTQGGATWQAVREFLLEQASDPQIGRDSVARRFGLHPSYLSLLCARHGERGFHGVLEGIRMERICRLLMGGEQAIGSVMRACGYADPGSGIRAFRRAMGCTPTAYRRRSCRGQPPR